MTWSQQAFDDAYDAMIECALWASTAECATPVEHPDNDGPIPGDELHDESDIDDDLLVEWRGDLRAFMEDNEADLDGMDITQIGHDFWLTRNHHGAGFWDRGLGERGQRLTDAAHVYGETDPQLYYTYDTDGEKVKAT